MAAVKDILAEKGGDVYATSRDSTVHEAAVLMNEHRIGALVVLDDDRVAGIFTERDVLRRVVAERRDPSATPVAEVMTTDVYCCRLETPLDEARGVMKNRRIRHLPVVDGDRHLLGMISIGDLNAFDVHSQEKTIHLLNEYIHGRT